MRPRPNSIFYYICTLKLTLELYEFIIYSSFPLVQSVSVKIPSTCLCPLCPKISLSELRPPCDHTPYLDIHTCTTIYIQFPALIDQYHSLGYAHPCYPIILLSSAQN